MSFRFAYIFTTQKFIVHRLVPVAFAMICIHIFSTTRDIIAHTDQLQRDMVLFTTRLQLLDVYFKDRQRDFLNIRKSLMSNSMPTQRFTPVNVSTAVQIALPMLKTNHESRIASGLNPVNAIFTDDVFIYQILPHLMENHNSLTPAYHLKGNNRPIKFVIGVPTVKRAKVNYLIVTISYLISGLTISNRKSTLIVVMIGETDLTYVLDTTRRLEAKFPAHVKEGLIEVVSPNLAYYPDFDTLPDTLGDSHERVVWRTKQNLDAIYLMAYARTKGPFFLMLEDDVAAVKNYLQIIRRYIVETLLSNNEWFFIEFCSTGGIGKLFKTVNLHYFIIYLQLFYKNMPIDWLLERYLADKVCPSNKTSKVCVKAKKRIRPKFKKCLFKHMGVHSSLKGKIHKLT